VKFKCLRCNKEFPTQKALTIHSEVKREDGTLAIFTPAQPEQENRANG
jgi:hypothetical protein